MAKDIWFISDTHFFHDNIIQYCGRPFANSDLMNECLVSNWNSVVKEQDKVYHLGDVALGYGGNEKELSTLLHQLNGHKRLLVGNHDNLKSPALHKAFEKILLWNGFHSGGVEFTAGHIPWPIEQLRDGKLMLHGHLHNNVMSDPRYMSACVEHIGYTPIHIEVVAEQFRKRDTNTHTNT